MNLCGVMLVNRRFLLSLFLALRVATATVSAQNIRWTGGDGNWTTIGNWDLGVEPTDAHNLASINNNAVITIDAVTNATLENADNSGMDSGTILLLGTLTVDNAFATSE